MKTIIKQAQISVNSLSLHLTGAISGSCYSPSEGYMVIPSDNQTYSSPYVYFQWYLSIAGRDYDKMLYTFYDYIHNGASVAIDDINYKKVVMCDQNYYSLRKGTINNQELIYPNPFYDKLELTQSNKNEITHIILNDFSGNLILDEEGGQKFLNEKLRLISSKISSGMYLLKIFTQSSCDCVKIIKM